MIFIRKGANALNVLNQRVTSAFKTSKMGIFSMKFHESSCVFNDDFLKIMKFGLRYLWDPCQGPWSPSKFDTSLNEIREWNQGYSYD